MEDCSHSEKAAFQGKVLLILGTKEHSIITPRMIFDWN